MAMALKSCYENPVNTNEMNYPLRARIPRGKRSPGCMQRCVTGGMLHPAQCHSLCWKINEKSLENSDFFGWFLFQFCNSTRTKRAQSKKVTLFQLLSTYNHCDTIKRKKMAHNLHNQFFLANNLGIIVTTNINPSVTFAAIKVSCDT